MNAKELFQFIRSWVVSIVPVNTFVIQSYQAGPAPTERKDAYLTIEPIGSWEKVGQDSKMIYDRPDLSHPRVTTYRGTIQVREVNGLGDLLRDLVESFSSQQALDYFGPNGVSILSTQGPTAIPSLQGSRWLQEHVLTLTLLWARADDGLAPGGSSSFIESVEIERDSGPGSPQKIFVQKPV